MYLSTFDDRNHSAKFRGLKLSLKNLVTNYFATHSTFDPPQVWILPFVFERLIIGLNPEPTRTLNQVIHERLRLFKSGQIELLLKQSNETRSKTSNQQAGNPVKISKAAQIVCDNNKVKSGKARLTSNLPVAKINDQNIEICRRLHFGHSISIYPNVK